MPHKTSEDSDQTALMLSLIRALAGLICPYTMKTDAGLNDLFNDEA